MKRIALHITIFSAVLFIYAGCSIENNFEVDHTPPSPPSEIYTVTGDERVDINWKHSPDRDVAGYNVYYSYSYDGQYTLLGSTESDYYIDYGGENGVTYYYAVTAYDYDGNESELSEDVVYDTPRPEDFNKSINDYVRFPNSSGYDFSERTVLPYDNENTDLFFGNENGVYYLIVKNDSDIQDMGPTTDLYDITEAPEKGWSKTKDAVAVPGHTYVIWTWDNHFAKIRISNVTPDRIVFDWAYQTSTSREGYRELKVSGSNKARVKIDIEEFHRQMQERRNSSQVFK